ncbi:hypothetical protein GCM10009624_27350 [Gordonia sinesedis]
MATHASSKPAGLARPPLPAARATYDVRSSCIGITLSIVALVVVLIALLLI